MDRLEILLRDTLDEHAADAPAELTPSRPRGASRSRARWAAVAAAAAVIAVAGGLLALQSSRQPDHPAAPAGPPTWLPAGFKVVSYHGIEIGVPSALRLEANPCGQPQYDTVSVDAGMVHGCVPITKQDEVSPPGLTVVALSGTGDGSGQTNTIRHTGTTVHVDGKSGRRSYTTLATIPGVTGVLTLPDPGVQISVTSPSRTRTDAILDTAHISPVDYLGCAAQPNSLIPAHNLPADELVPGSPASIVTCHYAMVAGWRETWLVGSGPLVEPNRLPALVAALNDLPRTTAAAGRSAGVREWIVFNYPDGTKRKVSVGANNSNALVIGDGQRFVKAVENTAVSRLMYPSLGGVR